MLYNKKNEHSLMTEETMNILLTGAFGIVGRETIPELVAAGHSVRCFDVATKATRRMCRRTLRRLARRSLPQPELRWGSLTDIGDVAAACAGMDAVIHLGAVIPPMADRKPELARLVNVGGTEVLVRCLERTNPACRLVFTSSIAIYGDRRHGPVIRIEDAPNPGRHDPYAHQKIEAEAVVRSSLLDWNILRLTYIVSADKLRMDPLMFEMPLDTPIEICHAADVALALRRAAEGTFRGQTFQIAGGQSCRTTFGDYLRRMLALFGFGQCQRLPDQAWSTGEFHCAWMDTEESQRVLGFQRAGLEEYYREVKRVSAFKCFLVRLARPLAWAWLLSRSVYWREWLSEAGGKSRLWWTMRRMKSWMSPVEKPS
jgi:nucleoside-diphosphate-sugar epimerase